MPSGIFQACSRCRTQKRKCDRRLPACSLCKRLKRTCSYTMPNGQPQEQHPLAVTIPELQEFSVPNIKDTLHKQIAAIIGDRQQVQGWAAEYFGTIHTWLPVICQSSYSNRSSPLQIASETSDFYFLTLAMYLVCVRPVNGELTSQTMSLYLLLKGLVSTLEAVGISNLEVLQGRLLMTIFEVGHALYPAAYISSAANARAAVDMGADATSLEQLLITFGCRERAEDAQRTWNSIIIADRYATLERSTRPSHIMELLLDKNGRIETKSHPLLPQTNPLTHLTEASHLLAQVLAHIHDTPTNPDLSAAEALRILRVGTAFLVETSKETPVENTISSSNVAVYRSAMLEMLAHGAQLQRSSIEGCSAAAQDMLKAVVKEIAQAATSVVKNPALIAVNALPVFVPHCLYKAAVVWLCVLKRPGQGDADTIIRPLVELLRLIGKRWVAAGMLFHTVGSLGVMCCVLTYQGKYAKAIVEIA